MGRKENGCRQLIGCKCRRINPQEHKNARLVYANKIASERMWHILRGRKQAGSYFAKNFCTFYYLTLYGVCYLMSD